MMLSVVVIILSAIPHDDMATDRVDIVEVSHFFDEAGRSVFDQVVFWKFEADGTQHVRAWRLWKTSSQTPWRDWRNGGYAMAWWDGDRLRIVRASSYRETWLQNDTELDDRTEFPAEDRAGLRGENLPPLSPSLAR